jgi:hypothetical protein
LLAIADAAAAADFQVRLHQPQAEESTLPCLLLLPRPPSTELPVLQLLHRRSSSEPLLAAA